MSTAEAYNENEIAEGRLTADHLAAITAAYSMGTREERIRQWQIQHGLKPYDSKAGPATRASIESASRPVAPPPAIGAYWDGPAVKQPRNRAEVIAMFGDPTGGGKYTEREKPDPAWVKANIIECHGATALHPSAFKRYCKVHKIVEPYMREAFRRAELACPGYVKVVSGPMVFRHMRNDPKAPLSNHSWGCAVDINPDDNTARYFAKGKAPEAWSPEWWNLWPKGIPKGVVDAFASCGFAWGSDWDEDGSSADETYGDPMHMEFVARDGKADQV